MNDPVAAACALTGAAGPAYAVSTACTSGAKAIAAGARLIAADLCDAVLCGGLDTLCDLTLNGFGALEALSPELTNPFSINRRGINIGEGAAPVLNLQTPGRLSAVARTRQLDLVRNLNALHAARFPDNTDLAARLHDFETAARMQSAVPGVVDISSETAATRELYGDIMVLAKRLPDAVNTYATGNVFGVVRAVDGKAVNSFPELIDALENGAGDFEVIEFMGSVDPLVLSRKAVKARNDAINKKYGVVPDRWLTGPEADGAIGKGEEP